MSSRNLNHLLFSPSRVQLYGPNLALRRESIHPRQATFFFGTFNLNAETI